MAFGWGKKSEEREPVGEGDQAVKDSYEEETAVDVYTAQIKYTGDGYESFYSYYKWEARVYCNGKEVDNEGSDWRWWLLIWVHLAAIEQRSKKRRKAKDRRKGTKDIRL